LQESTLRVPRLRRHKSIDESLRWRETPSFPLSSGVSPVDPFQGDQLHPADKLQLRVHVVRSTLPQVTPSSSVADLDATEFALLGSNGAVLVGGPAIESLWRLPVSRQCQSLPSGS
jgi:hypothetical protein